MLNFSFDHSSATTVILIESESHYHIWRCGKTLFVEILILVLEQTLEENYLFL